MKIVKIIGNVLLWICFAFLAFMLVVTVFTRIKGESPSLFGYRINIVLTGSMEPSISPGDVIIGKEYDGSYKLKEGDVVTYLSNQGATAGKLVTHQIISIEENASGTYTVCTQGTAEGATPDPLIDSSQIQSVVVRNSAVLRVIYAVISNPFGFFCLIILPLVAMIISEIVKVIKRAKQPDEE